METIIGVIIFVLFIAFMVWAFKKYIKGLKGFEAKNLGWMKTQAIINGKGVKFTCLDCGKRFTNYARNAYKIKEEDGKSTITSVCCDAVVKVRMMPQNVRGGRY